MKIICTLSTLLCLAAATAYNMDTLSHDQPYAKSLERRDRPQGVIRHENQNHDEHYIEAHKDRPKKHGHRNEDIDKATTMKTKTSLAKPTRALLATKRAYTTTGSAYTAI
ncbi:MAG: hypothetical protein J3Q66DRAFT_401484 [Benniella sp.]|nr:MAG: hypothetical protein J3Q66DRAFT_401484 [Benniella sp.]